jgi:hypothetical protein
MTNDEISEEGRKARFDRWERLGVDVIRTDLEATGGLRMVGGAPAVRRLAWEWVRMKEGEQSKSAAHHQLQTGTGVDLETATPSRQSKPELLTLKPTLWGVSIDLKELWRRVRDWRQRRT